MRILLILLCLCISSCSGDRETETTGGPVTIEVWAHAGQEGERAALEQQAAEFNRAQDKISVKLTFLPERSYNAQVQAAAVAGSLPDLLEFDGPLLYNYVWQGHLIPLDDLLSGPLQDDLLPSIMAQGTYRGRLYAVGAFDSGLGLYGRRSLLAAAGSRIPDDPARAWTAEEFEKTLAPWRRTTRTAGFWT